MKNTDTKEILLNAYLDLSGECSNLRDMAYSKAILWVLYADGRALNIDALIENIAQLVGASSLPKLSIISALRVLRLKKLILENSSTWKLSPNIKSDMDRQIKYSISVTDKIIKKRFPNQIDYEKMKNWFNDANSLYFSSEAEKLISLYTDKKKPILNVESTIKPLIKKYKLDKYQQEIIQGYKEFLMSDDREEEKKVLDLMRSILASKLVSANVSPEIFSLDRYKNTEIILDTNILFALHLYKNDGSSLEDSLRVLGQAIKSLNISLFVADFTVEEFNKVKNREKECFSQITDSYPENIFSNMSPRNQFAKTILKLGCKNSEDIKRFFDVGLEVPKEIGGVAIKILEKKEINGSYYNEKNDEILFQKISEFGKKSEFTIIHDLRLMKLIKRRNNNKRKSFVLTLDRGMEALALEQVNDKEDPSWISLYSLIQIFAINGAGPNFDPNDLAPLIKIFIEFEEATNTDKYDERDLILIKEKIARINEIPETKIISLLNRLHRVRLMRSEEEAVRDITLEIERTLRQNSNEIDKLVTEKQDTIENLNAEKTIMVAKIKGLISVKENYILVWFFVRVFIYIILATLLYFYLKSDILETRNSGSHSDLIFLMIPIISILGFSVTDYFTYTKNKLNEVKEDNQF